MLELLLELHPKCKQQDTHIANAQINQVISNNLALVE